MIDDVLSIMSVCLVTTNRRNIKGISIIQDTFVASNDTFSQVPCTCLPECFDKYDSLKVFEADANKRSQLAFKNIYGDVVFYHG